MLWDSTKFLSYHFFVAIIAIGNWDGFAVQKGEGFLIIAAIDFFLQERGHFASINRGRFENAEAFQMFSSMLYLITFHKFNSDFSFMKPVPRNAETSGHLG